MAGLRCITGLAVPSSIRPFFCPVLAALEGPPFSAAANDLGPPRASCYNSCLAMRCCSYSRLAMAKAVNLRPPAPSRYLALRASFSFFLDASSTPFWRKYACFRAESATVVCLSRTWKHDKHSTQSLLTHPVLFTCAPPYSLDIS